MNTTFTLIIVFIFMIITLVFIFILRNDLFKFIVNEEDFGTYTDPLISDCYNQTGKCSDLGTRTITESCIPNNITGKGCLDDKNNQTFATRITVETCTPICRSNIWLTESETQCIYTPDDINKICIPADTLGTQSVSQTCVPNDSTGSNECIIEVNPAIPSSVPPGCTIDVSTNNLAHCSTGTTVTITKKCPVVENVKPECGVYAIRKVIDEEYTVATYQCVNSIFPIPTNQCYGYDGIKYGLDSDFLKPGWNTLEMECVPYINTTATGTIPEPPTQQEICLPYTNCLIDSMTIVDNVINGNIQTVRCEDFNNITVPGCVQSCIYLPENFEPVTLWPPEFAALFGTLTYPQKGNHVVTMKYTPCPLDYNNAYVDPNYFSEAIFSDCFAYLGIPLLSGITVGVVNVVEAQNNYTLYNIIHTCTAPHIATSSSLLWVFKPRVTQNNSFQFRCAIFMIFGKNAAGYLTYNDGNLIWVQGQTSIFNDYGITEEQADTFIITYNGSTYTISYESGVELVPLSIPIFSPNGINGSITLDGLNFVSPIFNGAPLNSIEDINIRAEAIPYLLNLRYTREDPNTCNIFYKGSLPPGYPVPDI